MVDIFAIERDLENALAERLPGYDLSVAHAPEFDEDGNVTFMAYEMRVVKKVGDRRLIALVTLTEDFVHDTAIDVAGIAARMIREEYARAEKDDTVYDWNEASAYTRLRIDNTPLT